MSHPDYPDAPRAELVEQLHGHRVTDPYRWLEDVNEPATQAWSAAQDALFEASAGELRGRDRLPIDHKPFFQIDQMR